MPSNARERKNGTVPLADWGFPSGFRVEQHNGGSPGNLAAFDMSARAMSCRDLSRRTVTSLGSAMRKPEGFPPSYPKERRHRRFDLQCSVKLSFPSAGVIRRLDGISKNVSLGGVLVKAGDQIPPRTRVSVAMDVKGLSSRRPLHFLGEGEVVRVERLEAEAGFSIAIECQRPIAQIESPD